MAFLAAPVSEHLPPFSELPPTSANSSFHTPNGKIDTDDLMADDAAESVSLPRSRSISTSSSTDTASVIHDAVDDLYGRLSAELLNTSLDDVNSGQPKQEQEQQQQVNKTLSPTTSLKSAATLTSANSPLAATSPAVLNSTTRSVVSNPCSPVLINNSNNNCSSLPTSRPTSVQQQQLLDKETTPVVSKSPISSPVLSSNKEEGVMTALVAELKSLRADNERLNKQVNDLATTSRNEQNSAVNSLAMAIISNIASTNKANSTDSESQTGSISDQDKRSPTPNNAIQVAAPRHVMSTSVSNLSKTNEFFQPRPSAIVSCGSCVETKRVMSEVVHAVNTVKLELEELKMSQRRILECLKSSQYFAPSQQQSLLPPAVDKPLGSIENNKLPITGVDNNPPPPKQFNFATTSRYYGKNDALLKSEIPVRVESPPKASKVLKPSYSKSSVPSFSPTKKIETTTSIHTSPLKSSTPTSKPSPYLPSETGTHLTSSVSTWRLNSNPASVPIGGVLRSSASTTDIHGRGSSPTRKNVSFMDTVMTKTATTLSTVALPTAAEATPEPSRAISPPNGFGGSSSYSNGMYFNNFSKPTSPKPELKAERQAIDEIILKYLGNRAGSTGSGSTFQPSLNRSPSPTRSILNNSSKRSEIPVASPIQTHRKLFAMSTSIEGSVNSLKSTVLDL